MVFLRPAAQMNRVVCCQVALTDGYKLYLVCGPCFWQHDKHVKLTNMCLPIIFFKSQRFWEIPGETAGMHGLKETGKMCVLHFMVYVPISC